MLYKLIILLLLCLQGIIPTGLGAITLLIFYVIFFFWETKNTRFNNTFAMWSTSSHHQSNAGSFIVLSGRHLFYCIVYRSSLKLVTILHFPEGYTTGNFFLGVIF